MRFTQPLNKSHTKYAEALYNKVVRCDRVYDEYMLKGIFIEFLLESIYHSRRSYWGLEEEPYSTQPGASREVTNKTTTGVVKYRRDL